MNNVIGTNISAARRYLGLTLEQAAAALNISIDTLVQYEQGEKFPDSQMIIQFSKLYGISCKEILTYHYIFLNHDSRIIVELIRQK